MLNTNHSKSGPRPSPNSGPLAFSPADVLRLKGCGVAASHPLPFRKFFASDEEETDDQFDRVMRSPDGKLALARVALDKAEKDATYWERRCMKAESRIGVDHRLAVKLMYIAGILGGVVIGLAWKVWG